MFKWENKITKSLQFNVLSFISTPTVKVTGGEFRYCGGVWDSDGKSFKIKTWDVAPCSLVDTDRHFMMTTMMEAVSSSET
jgi:hypothetical protein